MAGKTLACIALVVCVVLVLTGCPKEVVTKGVSSSIQFEDSAAEKEKAPGSVVADPGASRRIIPGGVLLSHAVSHAVPSALKSLTSVFGMGTGVTSSLWPPKILLKLSAVGGQHLLKADC